MMTVRVKICGITCLDDALMAVDAGADALGFVFCETSPRCIQPTAAREIIRVLPPFVAKVGLFVDADLDAIHHTAASCGLDTIQLHGNETPDFCQECQVKIIKAFRIRDENSLALCARYPGIAWLLDSYVAGKMGGTGEKFNWDLAKAAARECKYLILAGGLTPENVSTAVRHVHPFAVDVSSGVESSPGRKDPGKVRAFVQAAKAMDVCPSNHGSATT